MFCLIVWYVSASCTVLNVLCNFFFYVSVLRSVLNVLCLIVWYVSASRTLFNVFCTICCYVSVLCTVLNVLGWIVCHVCASGTGMCSVDCLLRSSLVNCFLCVLLLFCQSSVTRTVLNVLH